MIFGRPATHTYMQAVTKRGKKQAPMRNAMQPFRNEFQVESPCFFDGSGHIRCLASDAPENSTSDAPDIGKSGFSDFRKSGFLEIQKSGNLKIGMFGFPEIRIFRNWISKIIEKPEIRVFGHSEFPDFRKIGKSRNPV